MIGWGKRRRDGAGRGRTIAPIRLLLALLCVLSACHKTLPTSAAGTTPYGGGTPYGAAPPASPPVPQYAMPPPTGSIVPPPALQEKRIYREEGDKSGRGDIDLRIERLWIENGFTYATVSVQNTSPYELEEITIKCTAFGRGAVNLDFREQTLLTRQDGRMMPGFQKTMKVRMARGGFSIREMSCSARGW